MDSETDESGASTKHRARNIDAPWYSWRLFCCQGQSQCYRPRQGVNQRSPPPWDCKAILSEYSPAKIYYDLSYNKILTGSDKTVWWSLLLTLTTGIWSVHEGFSLQLSNCFSRSICMELDELSLSCLHVEPIPCLSAVKFFSWDCDKDSKKFIFFLAPLKITTSQGIESMCGIRVYDLETGLELLREPNESRECRIEHTWDHISFVSLRVRTRIANSSLPHLCPVQCI